VSLRDYFKCGIQPITWSPRKNQCLQWSPRHKNVESKVVTFGYFAIANPSVSPVTFVHPTQPVEIFAKVSTPFCTLAKIGHPLTSMQNFTEIVPVEPLRRGLNARGVAMLNMSKAISRKRCKMRPRVQLMINRMERFMDTQFAYISEVNGARKVKSDVQVATNNNSHPV